MTARIEFPATVGDLPATGEAPDGTPVDARQQDRIEALTRELALLRQRVGAVLNSLPMMVGYWDRNLRNCLSNEMYSGRFESQPDEIQGRSMRELLGDSLFESNYHNVAAVLAGDRRSFERRVQVPGGPDRYYNLAYVPDIQDGRVEGFCVFITDVSARHSAAVALVESEQRYRAMFENLQSGFALHEVVVDDDGRPVDYTFLACNAAYTAMTGLTPERIVGRRVTQVLPGTENDPANWIGVFGNVALTGESVHLENYSEAIGRWYDVVAYRPGPRLFAVLIQDVTERRRIAAELDAQYERARVTLHSIADGVVTTDERGHVRYLNPVAERLSGWTAQEAMDRPLGEVFHALDETTRAVAANPLRRCLEAGGDAAQASKREHLVLVARDGSERNVDVTASPMRDAGGTVSGAVLVFHDVSEQRALAREITYRASHDLLTGLPNRVEFDLRLQRELIAAHESGMGHALLYIDLDQFKIVNDACGHTAGDELLREIAGVLRGCIRAGDTLARLGGDEFGVILQHCEPEAALHIAEHICESVDAFRFMHDGHRFRVGASIGVVPLDRRWDNATAVLQAADAACYSAKESGRNRAHAYLDADGGALEHRGRVRWAARLQDAIEEGRFVLHCQRIEALGEGDGGDHYEVLVRMVGDDGELIMPGAFIGAAERYQLVGRIDRWVVREVLRWLAEHRARLAGLGMIAVNLSGQSVGDRAFLRFVQECMQEYGIDGRQLCFEVTETAAISNLAEATNFIEAMRVHGCRFALDDFGSGLSSFGYLKTLPVDYLKIDGQFVRRILDDPVDRATVRCIQEVAAAVGKRTIAEFVENDATRELLREIGVDFAQGYGIHRPEPIDAILRAAG